MKTVNNMLNSEFKKLHAKFKTVSIIHLKELQDEIKDWKQKKLITEKFFNQNYGEFIFKPPKSVHNAQSIIIIGIPQKIIPLNFFYKGKKYQTIIPPTYVYLQTRADCKKILLKILQKKGYFVDRAFLPLKLLAVRSGLGQYGKNNICYVNGMGSFTRLEAFYTDYKFTSDNWQEKKFMESCKTCFLCKNACPTKCIPDDRFLIFADKCLTYFNENNEDFPAWISTQSHNAIVGCMRCQTACPHNKKFDQMDKPIDFSEAETSIILQKTSKKKIPRALVKKLSDLNLKQYYPLLRRNLSVLINK